VKVTGRQQAGRSKGLEAKGKADEQGRLQLHALPVRVTAKLVHMTEQVDDEEWRADYAEYLLGRPEVYLWEPPLRVFYIGGQVAA
jgi:hypothetical protein